MNSDESSRNMHYSPNRKPIPQKVYSPSTNYNYNGNQSQHGNHGGHGNPNYGNQHPRRKPNQFKRDGHGFNDRLFKQNDMIIRLLKEIRDRLPEPPVAPGDEISEPVQETMENTSPAPSLQEIPEDTTAEQETSTPAVEDEPTAVISEVSDDELDRQVNGNI